MRLNFKQLKIGGHVFKVKYDPNLADDRNRWGEVRFRNNVILLAPNLCKERLQEILLHEIFETLDQQGELDLPHRTIETLSSMMYQVLKDNELGIHP